MEINKENYEIFILDYYEGRLNQAEEQALLAFLDANPEIKAEFESFENISIAENDTIHFELKDSLKKPDTSSPLIINQTNYKNYFIAAVEADLTPAQKKQLDIFLLQHPDLNEEFHLFQLTKLTADKNIVFENKRQLKKFILFNTAINKKLIYQSLAIASSFLILISVSLYFFNQKDIIKQSFNTAQEISKPLIKNNKPNTEPINLMADSKINASNPVNHQTVKESVQNQPAIVRQTEVMHEIASIPVKNQLELQTVQIQNEVRNENLLLCKLLVLAEEQIAENVATEKPQTKESRRFDIDEKLYKENPLAQVGGFLKYYAVNAFSKAEEISTFANNTYQAVDKKIEGK
ncbi:MAG: hypothetical protein NTZ33_01785 [Bacteroidetes bacterium]|nr:hypothetical protein [Bacteroidota bacterium]